MHQFYVSGVTGDGGLFVLKSPLTLEKQSIEIIYSCGAQSVQLMQAVWGWRGGRREEGGGRVVVSGDVWCGGGCVLCSPCPALASATVASHSQSVSSLPSADCEHQQLQS